MKLFSNYGVLLMETEIYSYVEGGKTFYKMKDGIMPEERYFRNVSPATEEETKGLVQLDNGIFLLKEFGKYLPNLCFLSPLPRLNWEKVLHTDFNLPDGHLSVLKGDFFISKKGTKCFRVKPEGRHLLLQDNWGGPDYPRTRGYNLPEDQLYFRRASSNGGGTGFDYAVVPVGWRFSLTEEDI